MINWTKMKPREILEIASSLPAVAEPWIYEKKKNGIETITRRLVGPGHGPVREFLVQRWIQNLGPKWWGNWIDGKHVTSGDVDDAKKMGDDLLRASGYVLDDDLPCEIEDGVTEWCRGCGRLKREHQTYPKNPPRSATVNCCRCEQSLDPKDKDTYGCKEGRMCAACFRDFGKS